MIKDLGKFKTEPKYAVLWDKCVYELLYNPQEYTKELCALFNKYGVSKESQMLDTCAGSGFPALDMNEQGYKNITCVDGSDDQIELFNNKAAVKNIPLRSKKCSWLELPAHFQPEQFKALICKGSVWYAGGGWNKDFLPEREKTLGALKQTLKIFHSLLEMGGVLYIDKFKDTEVDHKDIVGTFEVGDEKKELIFWTHREKENSIRRAMMITKDIATGKETGLPNVTYDLKEEELEDVLKEVGFSITKPNFPEEKFFTCWLAIKN